ncbi:hypothetical protein [Pseudocolwellia agarivorans]|uniref:hypothetical protein n=1 Tax=Pseudocolwellia agarivorans TaxID=1911682 RepID=UPI000984A241|nr:hypothetical protein [Pseudocolwellia agarivorans]
MKNVKMLTNTVILALTLATSMFTQAAELVKVESVNDVVITTNVNAELAQAMENISILTLNIEETADAMLVNQTEEQFDASDVTSTLVAIAE